MKLLILSYFDAVKGPTPLLYAPEKIRKETLNQIADLMNLFDKPGFFVHIFDKYKSANLLFEIENDSARGGIESVLISLLTTEDNELDADLAKKLLEGFSKELEKIDKAYQALYIDSKKIIVDKSVFGKVKKTFDNFYKSIPETRKIETRREVKIFVFGLSLVGKTTIIKRLQNLNSNAVLPTTDIGISKIFLNNLSILIQDAPGQPKFRKLWAPYLDQNQDGLIFVMDISNDDNYEESSEILHEVANLPKMKDVPLLILLNKIDLKKVNIKKINKLLDLQKFGKRPVKSFLTSAIKDIGIKNSFNWLSKELNKNL